MPTVGKLVLDPLKTNNNQKGFYSVFSHEKEMVSPGYYKVDLDSYKIKAELPNEEIIIKIVTVFRELRTGLTLDKKTKIKSPTIHLYKST